MALGSVDGKKVDSFLSCLRGQRDSPLHPHSIVMAIRCTATPQPAPDQRAVSGIQRKRNTHLLVLHRLEVLTAAPVHHGPADGVAARLDDSPPHLQNESLPILYEGIRFPNSCDGWVPSYPGSPPEFQQLRLAAVLRQDFKASSGCSGS